VHGTPTGTAGVESGGDGGYGPFGTLVTPYRSAAAFGRFSYKLTDTIEFYAQATGAESWATGTWYPTNMITGANRANTFYADNPFLSPELQARINPTNTPGKTFQLAKFINQFGREGSPGTRNVNRYLSAAAGLSGVLGEQFVWDIYYTHGESRQSVTNYRNPNNQRWYAAEDAVRDTSGNIVCYVSTTVYADRFPGCKPMNPFGTTSMSQESYDYISSDTQYIMTNVMDDISASISGELFELPAGPLKGALSAETRWLEYGVVSNASPLDKVDCTGLRLCSTQNALWQQDTVNGLAPVSNNVWEVALELGAPLLKDLPLIQSLDINAGVRHTHYSTSGPVQTWKVGLDYHVNDEVRFRATTSVDIRAPTLNDLFSPVQSSITSFTDLLTGGYGIIPVTRQGNPNLKPEVARTYTAGIVLTPSWLDGLTFSYDYYRITIKNGIGALTAANNEIQRLCVNSGGTSPYCALYARPFPYSNTSAANYPTEIFNQSLNTAYQGIEGSDIEVNYHFDLASVSPELPGNMDLRLMANMQPVDSSQQFSGAVFTYATTPRGNVSATVSYNLGDWRFSLMDRWVSSYRLANTSTYVITPSRIGSQNYVDFAMQKRFSMDGGNYTAYLSIQNVLDTHTPLHPGGSGSPGLTYPTAQRGDIVGRYFTIGLRGNL
jgi:outer membrane receptor protein involved in Fe transport